MARHVYGRHEELKALHDRLDTPGFQMVSVYGRRRVGKTTLINKFVEESGARVISYVALERDEREQLESLGETVLACLAPDLIGSVSFDSFEKIFDFVARHAAQERIIFLIDEYPYLAKECRHMNSLLQRYVDHEWATTQLYLVLCGSLVTFMRESVLGKGAPLHGRSTLELRLRPMDYLESASFVPNYTNEEKAIVYGLTGGVPKYLEQFDDDKPLDDNIASQFFSSTGYFSEEQIQTLLTADRARPAAFNSIISSVALGHTKHNEIQKDLGGTDITYYLNVLVNAGVLEKRYSGTRPYYGIADGMVSFWYRYVNKAQSIINAGAGERYFDHVVKGHMYDFMGPVFEQMARQYLFSHMGEDELPFFATRIEEQQTTVKDPEGRLRQIELDLVGYDGKKPVLVGECKFRNQQFDRAELDRLMEKISLLPMKTPKVVLFSLGGFTQSVLDEDVLAIDIDMMYR